MKKVLLEWEGPFTFKEMILDKKIKEKYATSGLYIWIYADNKKSEILYVGKASGKPNLIERQIQHYMSYLGGLYYIPKEYTNKNQDWIFDSKSEIVQKIITHLDRFCEIVKGGFNFVNDKKIMIYFCKQDSANIRKIERQLLYNLKPKLTKMGTKTKPKDEIEIIHKGLLLKNN